MLFWPKLLSISHAIASSVRPYLPLYLSHLLGFTCSDIGILLAVPLGCRVVSLGLWTVLVIDQRPLLHGFFMALLTAIGTAALVLILWIPPHAKFAWSAALVCMFLDGIFYQPLTVIIDSAIIKILGNYKILLYDTQRKWGDLAAAIMAVSIGWSLDEDHDFDTLMGTILIGAVLLFLVSLSTTAIPADPALLGIDDDDRGNHSITTPLLESTFDIEQSFPQITTTATTCAFIEHNNCRNNTCPSVPPTSPNSKDGSDGKIIPTTTPSITHTTATTNAIHTAVMSPYYEHRPPSTYFYKPYCLFNEQLSHISEEDASMLRRMSSNANTHLTMKQHQHQHQQATTTTETTTTTPTTATIDSVISECIYADTDRGYIADYTAGGATTTYCTGPLRSSSQYWATTTTTTTASTTANNIHDVNSNSNSNIDHYLFSEMPSLQLALFPSPPSETPMVVLPIALTSTFIHKTQYIDNNINNNDDANNNEDEEQDDENETRAPDYPGSFYSRHNRNLWDPWPVYSLLLTVLLAGVVSSMMNALLYIYLHDGLGLPMHLIGMVGMVAIAAKVASKPLVHWAINRYSIVAVTGAAHVTLIVCAFGYTCLQPDYLLSQLAAVILQILQGAAFNSLWLIAVRQVDCVLLTAGQHQRMLLRGKMSALFNSLGPALGAIVSGLLVDACINKNIMAFSGFMYSYRAAVVLLAFCWAISRGWTVVADDGL